MLRPLKKRAMSWSDDCHGNPRALMTVSLSTASVLLLETVHICRHTDKPHAQKHSYGYYNEKTPQMYFETYGQNQQLSTNYFLASSSKRETSHCSHKQNTLFVYNIKNQTTANVTEYIPRSRFKLVVYSFKSWEFVIYKGKSLIMRSQATWSVVHIKSEIRNMFSQYINGTDQSTTLHDSL